MSVASRRRARGMWLLSGFGGGGGGVAPSYDTDAQTYITAVESADGQSLETGVKDAINAFVVGCKADGIWTAIKASCILAGARTLSGALVPLVGTAPTNNNFVSGDYSRTEGLTGDGSTKWLNSGRAGSSDNATNIHAAIYANKRDTIHGRYLSGDSGVFEMVGNAIGFRMRMNSGTLDTLGTATSANVLMGVSRSVASSYNWRDGEQSGSQSTPQDLSSTGNYFIFSRNDGGFKTTARLAFYSIGESLDLALLDTRVTTLITDIGAALA